MFAFLSRLASCGPLHAKSTDADDETAKKAVLSLPPAIPEEAGAASAAPVTATSANVQPTNPHLALWSGGSVSPANPHLAFSLGVAPPADAISAAIATAVEGPPTPRTQAAADETVAGAIQTALETAALPAAVASPAPIINIVPTAIPPTSTAGTATFTISQAQDADSLDGPRSEYLEYWAPRAFMNSALPTKAAFEDSLALLLGERCMLERAARGVVDPDASIVVTRI